MSLIQPFPEHIYVTQPVLPDIEEVKAMIGEIWESRYITNNGKVVQKLERELSRYLKVKNLSLFSNGTLALQIACRALRLTGEVITTPFTFAATPHALAWDNIKPVFCDIEEDSLNINPERIEELITPYTTAILPVHVFGNPCRVEQIQDIANRHGLKVIYDAAHAFGVKVKGKPVGSFGDISMLSLHATKIYHTIEGGALCFNSPHLKERADALRNFGIKSEEYVSEPGTNAKMNEVQAAVGILMLKYVDSEIKRRREITCLYRKYLKDIPGISYFEDTKGIRHNYSYMVIRVNREEFGISRNQLYEMLKEYNVFARKYFFPLCSQFPCYRNLPSASPENLPAASRIVEEVLSLPLYGRLTDADIEKICSIIDYIRSKA